MIRIENLHVTLPGFSLQDIDLSIEHGEFFTLLGPTGAGKTLVLEAIAGITPIASGRIIVNSQDITRLPPEKRAIGIVYQDYALFPHMNVYDNITYGLRYHKKRRSDAQELNYIIEQLDLGHVLKRSVLNLSGGEKQRVSLARALAVNPSILLLDEPLSALDPNFREEIREILKKLHQETGITIVMVTHDFTEAHFLARRTAIMNKGRVEQIGLLSEVFYKPATPFMANFVGMKNIFPAVIKEETAQVNDLSIKIHACQGGSRKYIAIRPEDILLDTEKSDLFKNMKNCFQGVVSKILNHGIHCDVVINISTVIFKALITSSALLNMQLHEGDNVFIAFDAAKVHSIA